MPHRPQPYVGARPFEKEDWDIFFGREQVADELVTIIYSNQALLLYGPLGAGKTSLVNARLIPLLQKEGFEVLPVVGLGHTSPRPERPEGRNIFVDETLRQWAGDSSDAGSSTNLSLSEFIESLRGEPDQERPGVCIFDQVERIFSFHPEKARERGDFFRQVQEMLIRTRGLRVVFIIREEFLGAMDSLAHLLPDRLRARARIEPLHADEAWRAIEGPLKRTGMSIEEGAAEQIVDRLRKIRVGRLDEAEVAGEYVQPLQLQLLLNNLWQTLPADGTIIRREHIEVQGDLEELLSRLYGEAVAYAVTTAGIEEGFLRRWVERFLITKSGTRSMLSRGSMETEGVSNDVLNILESRQLLRAELRNGTLWYELTNDQLIEPIKRSNRDWLSAQGGVYKTLQAVEERAANWHSLGRRGDYLSAGELLLIEQSLDSPETFLSDLGLSFVQASQQAFLQNEQEREKNVALQLAENAKQSRTIRRLKLMMMALTIISLLVVGLLVLKLLAPR